MTEDYVVLKDLAAELGLHRSNLRKYILASGFTFVKIRTPESRGQLSLALSPEDVEAVRELRMRAGFLHGKKPRAILNDKQGWFYAIQVIPELAPNRIKFGFSSNVDARLQAHRTSAPTAHLVKKWPCERCWENAIIASVTRMDCQLVANEVYDCGNLDTLISRCDDFFAIMPLVWE